MSGHYRYGKIEDQGDLEGQGFRIVGKLLRPGYIGPHEDSYIFYRPKKETP